MKRTYVFLVLTTILFMVPMLVTASILTDGAANAILSSDTAAMITEITETAKPDAAIVPIAQVNGDLQVSTITPETTERINAGNIYFRGLVIGGEVRTAVDRAILSAGSSVPAYTATDTIKEKVDLNADQRTSEHNIAMQTTGDTKATANSHEQLQTDAGADEFTTVDANTQALKITTFDTGNDAQGIPTATKEMTDDASAKTDLVHTYAAENTPTTIVMDTGTALANDTIEAGCDTEIISGTLIDDALAVNQSLETFANNAAEYYFTFDAANQTLTETTEQATAKNARLLDYAAASGYELDSGLTSKHLVAPISTRQSGLMGYDYMSATNSAGNHADISVDETTLSITLPTAITGQGEDLDSNGTIFDIEDTGAAAGTFPTVESKLVMSSADEIVFAYVMGLDVRMALEHSAGKTTISAGQDVEVNTGARLTNHVRTFAANTFNFQDDAVYFQDAEIDESATDRAPTTYNAGTLVYDIAGDGLVSIIAA